MRRKAAIVFLLMIWSVLCTQTLAPADIQAVNSSSSGAILAGTPTFSTYIGGSNDDTVSCIVADNQGNIYVAGTTKSNDLPSSGGPKRAFAGLSDYFVMKFTNKSELVYTTYIGGSSYEGSTIIHPDGGCWIDVDNLGCVYMTGYTYSSDFPCVNAWDDSYNGYADCFALKLSSSGASIEYATYLGGSQNELGTTIAVDDLGNAYITGWTASPNFPTQVPFDNTLGGSQDCFLLKLDPSGQLNYSTYVGGSVTEHSHPGGLVVDTNGTAYIIGGTASSDFPTMNAYDDSLNGIASDVFFSKVDSTGHLLASSFFGGSSSDENGAIAMDRAGNIYISGHGSGDFPKTEILSSSPEIFIAKFDNSGRNLIYSAAFGGMSADNPYGLIVDEDGCAFITGFTYSTDFPMANAYDDTGGGLRDSFLVKLSSGGNHLLFSSYFGGSSEEMGLSLAKTIDGSVYLAGITNSTDFPTVSPLVSTHQNLDGFLFRIEDVWPDIPYDPTSTTSPIPSTSSNPVTTSNPRSGFSYNLTFLLSFGIGFEIVVVLALIVKRIKHTTIN